MSKKNTNKWWKLLIASVVVAISNVRWICCLEEEALMFLHFLSQITRDCNLLAGEEGDMWEASCPVLLAHTFSDRFPQMKGRRVWDFWPTFTDYTQFYCRQVETVHVPGTVAVVCLQTCRSKKFFSFFSFQLLSHFSLKMHKYPRNNNSSPSPSSYFREILFLEYAATVKIFTWATPARKHQLSV